MKTISMRGGVEHFFTKIRTSGYYVNQLVDDAQICVPNNYGCVFRVRKGDDMALEMWPRFLLAAASCTSSDKVSSILYTINNYYFTVNIYVLYICILDTTY
jgi:hypothetical protein